MQSLVDNIDYGQIWQRVKSDTTSSSNRGNLQHNHGYATKAFNGNRCPFTGVARPKARKSTIDPLIVSLLQIMSTIGLMVGMSHPGMSATASALDRFRYLMFAGVINVSNMFEHNANCVTESDSHEHSLVVSHGDVDNAPEPMYSSVLVTGKWFLKCNVKDSSVRPAYVRVSNIGCIGRKEVSDAIIRMKRSAGMVQLIKEWLRRQPHYRRTNDPSTFFYEALATAGLLIGPRPTSIPAAMHLTPSDRGADASCLIHFANNCVAKHGGDIIMWIELMFAQNVCTEFYKLCNIFYDIECMDELPNECLTVLVGR